MLFSQCRRCLSREMLRSWPTRSFPIARAPSWRANDKQSRMAFVWPHTQSRVNPMIRRSHSTTTPSARMEEEGIEFPMDDDEALAVLTRAKEVWPCPPIIPSGWSCAWEHWSYLLTFYWLSPYFLMLPQIEMIVNIRHCIPGETRPILFSNEKQSFIFTLVEDGRRFFMYDAAEQVLWEFKGVENEKDLVRRMDEDFGALENGMEKLVPSEEGEKCLKRILARDETVIPVLAERFLDYTPEATNEWEEGLGWDELDEDEDMEALEALAEDVYKRLGPEAERAEMDSMKEELTKTAAAQADAENRKISS